MKGSPRKGHKINLEDAQDLNGGRTFEAEEMACAKILG